MKPETFTSFTFLSSLKANPSNTKAAYVKSQPNLKEDKYESVIMLMTNESHQQMTYLKNESNVMWKDDNTLVFQSKRDEKTPTTGTTLYALSLAGGEAYELFSVVLPLSSIVFLNNGSCIAIASYHRDHPQYPTYSQKKREKVDKEIKENDFVQVIQEVPFYMNGTTFNDHLRQRLVHVSADGKNITPLTPMNIEVSSFKVTLDETKNVFVGTPHHDVTQLYSYIYQTTLSSPSVERLSTEKVGIGGIELFNDKIIAYVSDRKTYGLNQNSVVCELIDGKFKCVLDPFYNIGNTINSDARLYPSNSMGVFDHTLVIHCTKKDHSYLIFLDHDFNVVKEIDVNGSCDGLTYINHQWFMISMQGQALQEITTLQGDPLTSYNATLFEKTPVCPPKPHHVKHHNRSVDGWVIMPPDYDTNKSYPAILVIHGGPKTVYSFIYTHEMQVWAHAGYVVMYCNPKGGDGLGNDFSDIRGQYGTQDMEDLLGFVDDVLLHYPNIDEQRLGITGGSYGGFMTNWITSHTTRFKAAVTQRSICNWTSFYGVSDIGHYFVKDQVQADLHDPHGFEKLWDNSPLKYVTNVTTPTLVVHSNKDYRCPIDQGYQWYASLKLCGVPTKLVMFHHENHDLTRNGKPKARLMSYNVILEWFNTYLK